MYTPEMATAFKAIVPPKNFGVTILENDDFLTIQIEPEEIVKLSQEEIPFAIKYIEDVKNVLEKNGANVLIIREPLEKDSYIANNKDKQGE
jgi:hypothetical protein